MLNNNRTERELINFQSLYHYISNHYHHISQISIHYLSFRLISKFQKCLFIIISESLDSLYERVVFMRQSFISKLFYTYYSKKNDVYLFGNNFHSGYLKHE